MYRFVVPEDGDTATVSLNGDITRLVATFMGVKVAEYGFVERSAHQTVPLTLNVMAFKGHPFVLECEGDGAVSIEYALYRDPEYRQWLSTQPVFRHGLGAYVMKDRGQEQLQGFDSTPSSILP